ncbi:hypothetical protein M3Y96_00130700 [Aphelenchoides besseyi]|nr:hypothetical protein M3Y96_00130700 [Aphelenchoides besseyi]
MFLLKCCVVFSLLFVILFGVFTHSFTKRLRYRLVQQKSNGKANDINQTPKFIRPQEAEDLECARLLDQTQAQKYAKDRLTYTDPPWPDDLPTDCHSINKRNYFQRSHLHSEERDFPIAFARAVYKDYRFLEMELAANYKPQNVYCYALDSKSSKTFHSRMNNLAACFPNVFVARRSFLMDSTGKNMNYAFFECLNVLQHFHWRYVILLQTNEELVRIFKWLNGTNDISSIEAPSKRIQKGINYSFKALKLFNNQSRNTRSHNYYPPIVQFAKSLAQVSVSRAAIDFMLNDMNLNRLLSAIEWNTYGTDELLMGTLNSHDAVDLPGGFTLQCLKRGFQTGSFTRLSYWQRNPSKCHSKMFRHRICIFGMEDILSFSNTPYLFANKMMPSNDFGAIVCWHEVLFNRTVYNRGTFRLDRSTYLEMPQVFLYVKLQSTLQVRFNRQRSELGAEFRANKFRCG